MTRESRDKQELRNRIRSAQGHMCAIERMIADDAPCIEILRQMLAVRGAVCAIRRELWRAYLLAGDCELQSDEAERRVRAWRELHKTLAGEPRS